MSVAVPVPLLKIRPVVPKERGPATTISPLPVKVSDVLPAVEIALPMVGARVSVPAMLFNVREPEGLITLVIVLLPMTFLRVLLLDRFSVSARVMSP